MRDVPARGFNVKTSKQISSCAIALLALTLLPLCCTAGTVVTIVDNVAHADISLPDGNGGSYDAEVTITFDSPTGLSVEALNLTAETVVPSDPAVTTRLPLGTTVEPAFPVMITVEPLDRGLFYGNGFGESEIGDNDLAFHNSYSIEIHTHELIYVSNSKYRVFKAPVGGAFADVSEDVLPGSVRMRGRGGEFSQFVAVRDDRLPLLVATEKLTALTLRTVASNLNGVLEGQLLDLLTSVGTAILLLQIDDAIAAVDSYLGIVDAEAGDDIANYWRAHRDLQNDAGALQSLAHTLRFSLSSAAARRRGG